MLNSPALSEVFAQNQSKTGTGTYLLPQAFPEGAPTHPAYPSGHATYVGAAATVLKAIFDESWALPLSSLKVPNADGTALITYTPSSGTTLTVGGELNNLASNIAIGRDWGGVHYRSDALEGIRLGEMVARRVLSDRQRLYNQAVRGTFSGFSFPARLDGGIELLSQPWYLAGSNGADEAYQSIDPNILQGKTLLRITYDLHGLSALTGDASAIIFDQGDWRYISLSNYGRNGLNGQQVVEILLSDFPSLNLNTTVGTLHTRFWYSSNFTVDILSIVVY